MKNDKTPQQTVPSEETGMQIEHLAKLSPAPSEMRIERNASWLQCNQARLREVLGRMVVAISRNLLRKVARAASANHFALLIDRRGASAGHRWNHSGNGS